MVQSKRKNQQNRFRGYVEGIFRKNYRTTKKITSIFLVLVLMLSLVLLCSCGKSEKGKSEEVYYVFNNYNGYGPSEMVMNNGYKYSSIPVSYVWMVDYDEPVRKRLLGDLFLIDENGYKNDEYAPIKTLYRNDNELLVLYNNPRWFRWMMYYSSDYDYPELSADVVDAVGLFKGRRDRILMDEDIVNSVFEIMSREELTFEDVGFTRDLQVISLYEYDSGIPLKSVCSFEEKEGKYYFRCRRDDPSSEFGFVNIYYETTEEEMDQIVNTVLKKGKAVRYPSMLKKRTDS